MRLGMVRGSCQIYTINLMALLSDLYPILESNFDPMVLPLCKVAKPLTALPRIALHVRRIAGHVNVRECTRAMHNHKD